MSTSENIEHVIAAIGLILVGIFMLATSLPAAAGDLRHDHDRDHDRGDTTSLYRHAKNLRGEDVAKGIAIGAVLTCGVRSVWSRVRSGRWTLCGDYPPPIPPPDPGPAVVTPDSLRSAGS